MEGMCSAARRRVSAWCHKYMANCWRSMAIDSKLEGLSESPKVWPVDMKRKPNKIHAWRATKLGWYLECWKASLTFLSSHIDKSLGWNMRFAGCRASTFKVLGKTLGSGFLAHWLDPPNHWWPYSKGRVERCYQKWGEAPCRFFANRPFQLGWHGDGGWVRRDGD